MELYLVRHGETQWNIEKRFQGQKDSPLTEKGRNQIVAIAESLKGIQFDRLISSDLGRALETSEILSKSLNLKPIIQNKLLRERNFGIFHGLTREEAERLYPSEWGMVCSADDEAPVPEGETRHQMRLRVQQFLSEIPAMYPGERLLAVTHGGVVNMVIRFVLRIPFSEPRRFRLPNAGLSILVYEQNEWFVRTLNALCPLTNRSIYDDTI